MKQKESKIKELTRKQKLTLKAKESAIKFKNQLKKSVFTAIIAAFGLILALTWNDFIKNFVDKVTELSPFQSSFISALTITMISVLGIVIVSRFNK